MCIRDLDKQNLIWWFDFCFEPIFATAPADSKIATHVKSGQNWPESNHLAYFTKVKSKFLIPCVAIVQLIFVSQKAYEWSSEIIKNCQFVDDDKKTIRIPAMCAKNYDPFVYNQKISRDWWKKFEIGLEIKLIYCNSWCKFKNSPLMPNKY